MREEGEESRVVGVCFVPRLTFNILFDNENGDDAGF